MNHEDQIDLFIRSLDLLRVDEYQITEAGETDVTAILQVVEGLATTTPTNTPADLALHRLLVLTASLIMVPRFHDAGIQTNPPKPLGREWHIARAEIPRTATRRVMTTDVVRVVYHGCEQVPSGPSRARLNSPRGTRHEHAAMRPTESSPAEIPRYPKGAQ